MIKARFSQWNISKYIRHRDAVKISQDIDAYRKSHDASPGTIEVNGRQLDARKVKKSLRRHQNRKSNALQEPGTFAGSATRMLLDNCQTNDLSPQAMFTAEDMDNLGVAILQTDYYLTERVLHQEFHDCSLSLASSPTQQTTIATNLWSQLVPRYLGQFQDMIALEIVLQQSEVYYGFLADQRRGFLFSEPESLLTLDFYARYWLGMILSNRQQFNLSTKLLGATEQVEDTMSQHHPHFLPWLCFAVCCPDRNADPGDPGSQTVGKVTLERIEKNSGLLVKNWSIDP